MCQMRTATVQWARPPIPAASRITSGCAPTGRFPSTARSIPVSGSGSRDSRSMRSTTWSTNSGALRRRSTLRRSMPKRSASPSPSRRSHLVPPRVSRRVDREHHVVLREAAQADHHTTAKSGAHLFRWRGYLVIVSPDLEVAVAYRTQHYERTPAMVLAGVRSRLRGAASGRKPAKQRPSMAIPDELVPGDVVTGTAESTVNFGVFLDLAATRLSSKRASSTRQVLRTRPATSKLARSSGLGWSP
jgi:hypothetical protein